MAADKAPPSFANTIEALERGGRALDQGVEPVLRAGRRRHLGRHRGGRAGHLAAAGPPLQRIYLNARAVPADRRALRAARALGLTPEQTRVLERYHTRFVRAGAALDKRRRAQLAAINERLATLGTQFGQNVLADEKAYALILDEADLAGLPDFAKRAMPRRRPRSAATRANTPSRWRALRSRASCSSPRAATCAKRCSTAWLARGENGGRPTTAPSSPRSCKLRAERAQLLGFTIFADYRLDDQMAKTPQAARATARRGVGPRARPRAGARRTSCRS